MKTPPTLSFCREGFISLRRAALLALVLLASAARGLAANGEKILDAVLRAPGDYGQACGVATKPMPLALPVWRPGLSSGDRGLSEKKRKFLQEKRADVLPALQRRLESVDFSRQPQPQPIDKKPDKLLMVGGSSSGVDPQSYSDLLLHVVLELKAVEALPQLLNLEARLHGMLARAEKDPKVPLPQMEGFSAVEPEPTAAEKNDQRDYDKLPAAERARRERRNLICYAQAGHRTLLSVIGNLLRGARHQPLLDSRLEKAYQANLRKEIARDKVLKSIKTADDIPPEHRDRIWIDPVSGLPTIGWSSVDIPYSAELRASIRRMAADYLAGNNVPRG